MVACVAQQLIKRVWEEVFAKDMRFKHDFESEDVSEEERPFGEGDGTYLFEQELPFEEADPWEVEEEVDRWMRGEASQDPPNAE